MTECELFKVRVEHDRKPVSEHPWQRTIKSEYSRDMKHCHNSLRNPNYPEVKKKGPYAARVKFSVIGNRVTREFIYCSNLVRGICTYRWKSHEPPVIRGLTSVEWTEALRDLKSRYGDLAHCLEGQVAVLYNDQFLGGQKELKNLIETKYIYHVCVNYRKEALNQFASYVKGSGRPCVYMHIAIDGRHVGTMIFMLYSDIVPRTCENFLRLCQAKRGGYSGTPVHRIVKDGWIQCGGYGLKDNVNLNCEHFAVPHDRRGVLCMANDGRDVDCSTQFFVLLQPSPWMAHKYVAFGQLIDGDATLKMIEQVPSFYESPKEDILIHKSGILNLECQDIKINKTASSYIQGHIEDLVTIGELFWELLMEHVYLEIEFRRIAALEQTGEDEQEQIPQTSNADMRATKRFIRRKETMDREGKASVDIEFSENENNDFDVEDYAYEPEESYSHVSLAPVSLPPKPEKLFYIPLTDVPYPGEVDSTYDLKKFLKGNYCLESDLEGEYNHKSYVYKEFSIPVISDIFSYIADDYAEPDEEEMDSDDELEIKKYLKAHGERVSFAGRMVRGIAKGAGMPDLRNYQQEEFTDECIRKVRLASVDVRRKEIRKVSIYLPPEEAAAQHNSIKRRQTGFVRPEDLAKIHTFQKHTDRGDVPEEEEESEPKSKKMTDKWKDDEEEEIDNEQDVSLYASRKVSVSINAPAQDRQSHIKRRQTGFVRSDDLAKIRIFQKSEDRIEDDEGDDDETENKHKVRISSAAFAPHASSGAMKRTTGYQGGPDDDEDDDDHQTRPSVMARLYDDVAIDDDEPVPTLKDYKPLSEARNKNPIFLTRTATLRDDDDKGKYGRPSIIYEEESFDQILNMQQGKQVARKISSDYVKTMDHIDRKPENSLRTLEFARTRPTMTVSEYQQKNQRAQELLAEGKTTIENKGLRLPGDTPLYSTTSVVDGKTVDAKLKPIIRKAAPTVSNHSKKDFVWKPKELTELSIEPLIAVETYKSSEGSQKCTETGTLSQKYNPEASRQSIQLLREKPKTRQPSRISLQNGKPTRIG